MWHANHSQLLLQSQDTPLPPKPGQHPARLSELLSLVAPQRIFPVKQCEKCLTIWNRDVNAARNIRRVGLLMFTGQPRHVFFRPATPG
jgi:hypothetical protein